MTKSVSEIHKILNKPQHLTFGKHSRFMLNHEKANKVVILEQFTKSFEKIEHKY